jgi:hypothetical protein
VAIVKTLFTSFVAQERGQTRQHIHGLINSSIWPNMDNDDKFEFFKRIADEFLSSPLKDISQKAIINALDLLDVPNGLIMMYLVERLGFTLSDSMVKNSQGSQLIRISSMLHLCHNQLARIQREVDKQSSK